EVKVKVLEIDNRGKVRLSMRVVNQETGEELEDTRPPREPREPRGDREGGRGGDRRGPRGDRGGRDRGPRRDREARPKGDRGRDEGPDPAHIPAFLKDDSVPADRQQQGPRGKPRGPSSFQVSSFPTMITRELLGTAQVPGGKELRLFSHGRDFMIVLGHN